MGRASGFSREALGLTLWASCGAHGPHSAPLSQSLWLLMKGQCLLSVNRLLISLFCSQAASRSPHVPSAYPPPCSLLAIILSLVNQTLERQKANHIYNY